MDANSRSRNPISSSLAPAVVAAPQNSSENHVSSERLSEDNHITTSSITENTPEIDNTHPKVDGTGFLSRLAKVEMMDVAAEESQMNSAPRSALDRDMPPLSEVRPNSGPNPSPLTQPSLQSSEKE